MPILFLTVVIDLIGFGIMLPIVPFMAPQFGGTAMDIALIIAIYSIFAGLCGPFWGRMSDKFGRKPVILVCLAGAAAGYLMMAFATELWMLYFARAFAGLMAGNFGVAMAMISDISTPENRAKSMGMIGAAFGIGMVIGPSMGGILAGNDHNYMLPMLTAAALSTTAMLAGALLLQESMTAEKRVEHAAQHKTQPKQSLLQMVRSTGNLGLAGQYLLHNTSLSMAGYLFPLWVAALLGWGPMEVGYVFAAQGILTSIVQFRLVGPLSKYFGELRFLLIGITCLLVGFTASVFASSMYVIIPAFAAIILGTTVCTPMLNTLVSKRTPPPMRGRMLGTTSSLSAWGRTFGPLVGGAALSLGNFQWAWAMGIIIALVYASWPIGELRSGEYLTRTEY